MLSGWHLIVLVIVVALVFGTKKLRNVGEDLGEAIKGFKKGMQDGDSADAARLKADPPVENTTSNAAPNATKSEHAE